MISKTVLLLIGDCYVADGSVLHKPGFGELEGLETDIEKEQNKEH